MAPRNNSTFTWRSFFMMPVSLRNSWNQRVKSVRDLHHFQCMNAYLCVPWLLGSYYAQAQLVKLASAEETLLLRDNGSYLPERVSICCPTSFCMGEIESEHIRMPSLKDT